jgi:hypothetical protein
MLLFVAPEMYIERLHLTRNMSRVIGIVAILVGVRFALVYYTERLINTSNADLESKIKMLEEKKTTEKFI